MELWLLGFDPLIICNSTCWSIVKNMGRRTHLVRRRVLWATLVLFRRTGWGLLGVPKCVCAPTVSLCGGAALAPMEMGGPSPMQRRRMERECGLFFWHFFSFWQICDFNWNKCRRKKYSSEEAEAPSSVMSTSKWKTEQLVKRGKKKSLHFLKNTGISRWLCWRAVLLLVLQPVLRCMVWCWSGCGSLMVQRELFLQGCAWALATSKPWQLLKSYFAKCTLTM